MSTGTVELPWLLRWWRTAVVRLSQKLAAAEIAVSKSALSMWENGRRRPSKVDLQALDRSYEAGGALADLAQGLKTPDGLPARRTWVHSPDGSSGPVWAWLRPPPGRRQITARARWGPLAFDYAYACDDRGFFLTSPFSIPNPPTWIDLDPPGWVDFGRGEIPVELGIPQLDALSGKHVEPGGHSPLGLVISDIIDRFKSDLQFANGVRKHPDLILRFVDAIEYETRVLDLTTGSPQERPHEPFTGTEYRLLREVRGFSQAEVAKLTTAFMPFEPVAEDQIRVLENGGNPRARYLRSRLDRLYRADGSTCIEEVKVIRGRPLFTFNFPTYWVGPVWLSFVSDRYSSVRAVLKWDQSFKSILVNSGATVTCRKSIDSSVHFEVYCPPGWNVTAGMGIPHEARDINWGWTNMKDDTSRTGAELHELALNRLNQYRSTA